MNIRNKRLYDEIKNATMSAFRILRRSYEKKPPLRTNLEEKIVLHRDGSISTFFKKVPDLHYFIQKHNKSILNLPGNVSLRDYIEQNNRFKLLRKIDGNQAQYVASFVLIHFVSRLAEKIGSFEFSQEAFDYLYCEYENHLYLDTIKHHYFSILENFECDIDKIKLFDGLIIKKISNSERRKILRMRTITEFDFLRIKWIIKFQFGITREERFTVKPAEENFGSLISALRLFKPGAVGYKHIYSFPDAKWDLTVQANLVEPKLSGKKYILSATEINKFKKWWKEFRKCKNLLMRTEIRVAIHRFNYAYERMSLEDKLIDYVIAFESLLLKGEPEKRFKFSLRGAFLLGKEKSNLRERYNYMKETQEYLSKAYKYRNNIVHGSRGLKNEVKVNEIEIPTQEFIEKIEDYLRKAIKIYLRIAKQQSKDNIIKELDASIFYPNWSQKLK